MILNVLLDIQTTQMLLCTSYTMFISLKILVLRSSGLNMELETQQDTSQYINLLISWGQIFANLYLRLMYCLDVM